MAAADAAPTGASLGAMAVQGSGLSTNIAEKPARMPATLLIHSTRAFCKEVPKGAGFRPAPE